MFFAFLEVEVMGFRVVVEAGRDPWALYGISWPAPFPLVAPHRRTDHCEYVRLSVYVYCPRYSSSDAAVQESASMLASFEQLQPRH